MVNGCLLPKCVYDSKLFSGNRRYVVVVPDGKRDISTSPFFYNEGRVGCFGKNSTAHLLVDRYVDYVNILDCVDRYNRNNPGHMCNVFMNCYPDSSHVYMIILDFDGNGDLAEVYDEVSCCYDIVMDKGFNAVIVMSGSKGFHLYIQIPCTNFSGHLDDKVYFIEYWKQLIDYNCNSYKFLDENHFRNGLGGNIRLIGSVHPKAGGGRTRVFKGAFCDVDCFNSDTLEYHYYLLERCESASNKAYDLKQARIKKRAEKNLKITKAHGFDPNNIDLRDLFKALYPGNWYRDFERYSMFCCPFHGEEHASLMVFCDYYICKACGERGYIHGLVKSGVLSWEDLKKIYS